MLTIRKTDKLFLIYVGKMDNTHYLCIGKTAKCRVNQYPKSEEAMIKRKIETFLDHFYQSQNKALLVTGARQTGKTFSIREFARRNYSTFIEINFIESPSAKDIFLGARDAHEVLFRLSAFVTQPLVPGKTLIFLDEVQECPEAVTLIKFLVDEGSYRYALSGSLLGVELKDLRSEPVGYLDVKEMFPLDFEEFCLALGMSQQLLDMLSDCFHSRRPVDPFVHGRMMSLFRLYLMVGGMPAAVSKYLSTNNMQEVVSEQQAILRLYKRDIAKYDPQHKLHLNDIFELIPSELNAKNKRFILKSLNENMKFSRHEDSFLWLKDAGVALPTYNVEEPRLPLLLSKQRNLFKLFQNDVGLLACQYASSIGIQILKGDSTVNFGSIYENAVAQELHAHGFPLYYFNSKRQGELDFIVEDNAEVLPIEVKSGKDYARHNALSNILNTPDYNIRRAMVFCNDNVSCRGAITYYPIYMLMFLQREEPASIIYPFDMTGLT